MLGNNVKKTAQSIFCNKNCIFIPFRLKSNYFRQANASNKIWGKMSMCMSTDAKNETQYVSLTNTYNKPGKQCTTNGRAAQHYNGNGSLVNWHKSNFSDAGPSSIHDVWMKEFERRFIYFICECVRVCFCVMWETKIQLAAHMEILMCNFRTIDWMNTDKSLIADKKPISIACFFSWSLIEFLQRIYNANWHVRMAKRSHDGRKNSNYSTNQGKHHAIII